MKDRDLPPVVVWKSWIHGFGLPWRWDCRRCDYRDGYLTFSQAISNATAHALVHLEAENGATL